MVPHFIRIGKRALEILRSRGLREAPAQLELVVGDKDIRRVGLGLARHVTLTTTPKQQQHLTNFTRFSYIRPRYPVSLHKRTPNKKKITSLSFTSCYHFAKRNQESFNTVNLDQYRFPLLFSGGYVPRIPPLHIPKPQIIRDNCFGLIFCIRKVTNSQIGNFCKQFYFRCHFSGQYY